MKIYSEKTLKYYSSIEECLEAEKKYDEELAAKKAKEAEEEKALIAKKEAAIAERKEAAKKVEDARKTLIAAQKTFKEELSAFCQRFGPYHYTISSSDDSWTNLFDNFWNHFWF